MRINSPSYELRKYEEYIELDATRYLVYIDETQEVVFDEQDLSALLTWVTYLNKLMFYHSPFGSRYTISDQF